MTSQLREMRAQGVHVTVRLKMMPAEGNGVAGMQVRYLRVISVPEAGTERA